MTAKSLENWKNNGWIKAHKTSVEEISNLIRGGERKLADAKVDAISADGRLQFAYEGILRFAMVALAASGYRASSQSHHFRSIASLGLTVGLPDETVRLLDLFRRKRNISLYDSAGDTTEAELEEVLEQAEVVQEAVMLWLRTNHSKLLVS